ncbi:MAG TPA: PAS domain S-box protein [Thermoanaerobaculia bacterium]|nr:PAS domain S-box protein [Thermoanaerobaculia bacterium]
MSDSNRRGDAESRRRAARERLETRLKGSTEEASAAEVTRLLHELEVHQIELELQNEELRESRAEAEASLARYQELYDFAPVGYLTLDAEGKITRSNLAAARLLGHERDRLLQLRLEHLVDAADRAVVRALLARVFAGGGEEGCEARLSQGGRPPPTIHLGVSLSPGSDECRAVLTDVSERNAAARRAVALVRTLTLIAEGAPLARVLDDIASGVEDLAAPAACNIVLPDQPILVDAPGFDRIRSLADLRELPSGTEANPRARRIWAIAPLAFESLLAELSANPDDRTAPSRPDDSRLEPIVGPDGRALGLLVIRPRSADAPGEIDLHAISAARRLSAIAIERQQDDCALRTSEETFRELSEYSPTGIFRTDAAGCCTYTNARWQEIFGISLEQSLGDGWSRALHPDDREQVLAEWRRAAGSASPLALELRIVRPDGAVRELHVRSHPLRDESGAATSFVGSVDDLTAQKRAEREREALEAELRQAHKMESVGRLAGGIAHDFNNMLGVILGHTGLALAEVGPEGPVHDSLERVRAAASRSADLTRQLLAFARKQPIYPQRLDLNDCAERMLQLLEPILGEGIELIWRPAPDLWPVLLDPAQLDQVLTNLAVNARDAMRGAGVLTITTDNLELSAGDASKPLALAPGGYVRLRVADSGAGMDEEDLSHLFEPFYTTKPVGKGTGLGLATVYGIVRQNGGSIEVASAPGEGTTLAILLPRAGGEPARPLTPPHPLATSGSETILLVEDEPALLTLCTSVLERLGYSVLSARDGAEASALAAEHEGPIHLLLTDVKLPGIDGAELASQVAVLRPEIKMLYISGYSADSLGLSGVLGAEVDLLEKPFSLSDLETRVRASLDR